MVTHGVAITAFHDGRNLDHWWTSRRRLVIVVQDDIDHRALRRAVQRRCDGCGWRFTTGWVAAVPTTPQ